jgi:hypothetical protein
MWTRQQKEGLHYIQEEAKARSLLGTEIHNRIEHALHTTLGLRRPLEETNGASGTKPTGQAYVQCKQSSQPPSCRCLLCTDSFQTSYRFLFPPVAFPEDPDPLGRPAGAFFALDSFPLLLRSSCTWIPGNQEVTSNLGMVCVFRGMNREVTRKEWPTSLIITLQVQFWLRVTRQKIIWKKIKKKKGTNYLLHAVS